MRRIIYLLTGIVLFLSFLHYAYADDSWVIENFQSQIAIEQTGLIHITETISVDFKDTPEHGIYREIPYLYQINGHKQYTKVQLESVIQNNEPAQYTSSQVNGFDVINIGDPNKTIDGRNVYTISYTVTGILRQFANHDALFWNVTGNTWPVGIEKAEASVTMPAAGISKIACFEGNSSSIYTLSGKS